MVYHYTWLFGFSGEACIWTFFVWYITFLRCNCRKRKLTDHWRNFIRPLTWRCKWTELRIKEIDSLALKYSKELAEYDKGKHTTPGQFSIEEFGSKSLPFLGEKRRNKANKRRKRKKIEDTTEIGSYTSHHYIFSYLGTTHLPSWYLVFLSFHVYQSLVHALEICVTLSFTYVVESKKSDNDGGLADDFGNPG